MPGAQSLSDLAPTTTVAGGGGGRGAVDSESAQITRRHGGVIDGIVLTKFDTIDDKVARPHSRSPRRDVSFCCYEHVQMILCSWLDRVNAGSLSATWRPPAHRTRPLSRTCALSAELPQASHCVWQTSSLALCLDKVYSCVCGCLAPQVGAALSMVYTSGAPVMFVGCGQTYVDLKKLNVKSVVKSLLK